MSRVPEVMEVSLWRVIPRSCWPGCAVQGCVGTAPCPGVADGRCVPSTVPWCGLEGWAAPPGCERAKLSWREQGEMFGLSGAVWGRAGSAWHSTGTVLQHPSASCLLLCPGLSMLGFSIDVLASCKVILHFIASFLP